MDRLRRVRRPGAPSRKQALSIPVDHPKVESGRGMNDRPRNATTSLIDQLQAATPDDLASGQSIVIVLDWESADLLFVTRPYERRSTAHCMQTRHNHVGRAYVACRHAGGTTYMASKDYTLGTIR